VVVCPNRLGAINQCLLVLDSLPPSVARRAQIVLVSPPQASAAGRGNVRLLGDLIGARRIHVLPWIRNPGHVWRGPMSSQLRQFLRSLDRIFG